MRSKAARGVVHDVQLPVRGGGPPRWGMAERGRQLRMALPLPPTDAHESQRRPVCTQGASARRAGSSRPSSYGRKRLLLGLPPHLESAPMNTSPSHHPIPALRPAPVKAIPRGAASPSTIPSRPSAATDPCTLPPPNLIVVMFVMGVTPVRAARMPNITTMTTMTMFAACVYKPSGREKRSRPAHVRQIQSM